MRLKYINRYLTRTHGISIILFSIGFVLLLAFVGMAQIEGVEEVDPSAQQLFEKQVSINTIWVTLTAIPVFFMNLGYALWCASFCGEQPGKAIRRNLIILAVSVFAFWAFGIEKMLFLSGADNSPAMGGAYPGAYSAMNWAGIPLNVKFLFAVSNAVVSTSLIASTFPQQRKLSIVFAFCLLFVCFIYPITGHWIRGGGWLARTGFWDFAGSTVIFSVGGWAALTGAWVFHSVEKPHSDIQSVDETRSVNILIGFLTLCLGWIALNAGSIISVDDGRLVSHIAITTIASAIGGAIGAMITCWIYLHRQEATRIIQGVLSGLVAISAPCAFVSTAWAVETGFIASILTFLSVDYLKKTKISDVSGLIPIHLIGGIWGTLSVGLFAAGSSNAANGLYEDGLGPMAGLFAGGGVQQLSVQLVGIIAVGVFTALLSWIFCLIIKSSIKSSSTE